MKKNTTAALMDPVQVEIDAEQCKGCALCVIVCASCCLTLDQAVFNTKGFHPAVYSYQGTTGNCSACGVCYLVCPDYAVRSIGQLKKET